MNRTETNDQDRLARSNEFRTTYAAAFPPNSEAAQLFAEIDAALQAIDTHAAAQVASVNSALESTVDKTTAYADLRARLKAISLTANSMAVDDPGIRSKFRMPVGNGHQALINAARGAVTNATPIKAAFIAKEMPADFLTALEASIARLEQSMSAKRRETEAHVAARAGVKAAITNGLKALRKVDPIVRNKFRDDPVALAAWDTASRPIRHQRKPKPEPAPAPSH